MTETVCIDCGASFEWSIYTFLCADCTAAIVEQDRRENMSFGEWFAEYQAAS